MNKEKIAIFGASGLVGSRLCESLYQNNQYDFRALIHSAGNAFRIAKYPMEIEQVNLLDKKQIDKALRGCSIVVNCTRGGKNVMIHGFKNLLSAAKKNKVRKFIHLSSVLIYGEEPPEESFSDKCRPDPQGNDYGILKLKQDDLLLKQKHSFQSIILCPPNIYGPFGGFTYLIIDNLLKGAAALVDDGKNPCNLVHVDNLVLGIYKAIENESVNGERFFIQDKGEPTWKEFLTKFSSIMGTDYQFDNIDSSLLKKNNTGRQNSKYFFNPVKFLVSPEIRGSLAKFPVFDSLLEFTSYRFSCLDPKLQERIRQRLSASIVIPKKSGSYDLNNPLLSLQTRKVNHSINRARTMLDYHPLFDLDTGLENTKSWIKFFNLDKDIDHFPAVPLEISKSPNAIAQD